MTVTVFADPQRQASINLDYGFSVRQVNDAGTVISPDTGDLDVATSFGEAASTWTNSRRTITGSRVYPAGRYSVTPFYKLSGTSNYIKLNGLTKYFQVAVDTSTPTPTPGSNTSGTWLSGSSGEMTASGKFGNWRGRKDDIAATWQGAWGGATADVLKAGNEYGNWQGNLLIAIPPFSDGSSYSAAATGAQDQQWTDALNALKSQWTRIPRGKLFIVWSWEWNGDWFNWSVRNTADQNNFRTALKRFANLKKSIFPDAKLGTILNKDSKYGLDWRKAIPGYGDGSGTASQWLDFGGVDWYNNYDVITNSSQVTSQFNALGPAGEPYGLETHRKFWESQGVPIILQEWGNNAAFGDNPPYIQAMFDFFKKNGGTGAGNVIAEIYFNTLVAEQEYKFFLYNDGRATRNPNCASLYKQLWPTAGPLTL
ncbi:hypothetical protein AB0941_42440 [Streptomyces sp. NPDC013433]